MFHFFLGNCGTGKSTVLMQQIEADLLQQKEVLLLVPEQFSFEAEKKLYNALGAQMFNQFRVYSFATLSHEILKSSGTKGDYVSEQEKQLFLYQAVQHCIQQNELVLFHRNGTSADFLMHLKKMITKIRKAGIPADALLEKAKAMPKVLHDKTCDIAMILLAYDRILQEHALCDSLADLTEAASIAQMQDFFIGKQIYLDEFDSFTGDQYQMLAVIFSQAAHVTAAIRADNPQKMPTGIFIGGNQTYHQLRNIAENIQPNAVRTEYYAEYCRSAYPDLQYIAENILRRHTHDRMQLASDYHVHIFQAQDAEAEIEYICASIYHLLSEDENLHCRDIAIAVKNTEVYLPLLERAMQRYALPYDIASEKSILHTELIRYFLLMLEILSSSSWRTETLLKYLQNPFAGYDRDQVAMLEHFCFTWSIDKEDWTKPFGEMETKAFGGMILEELRLELLSELQTLRKQCHKVTVRQICSALYQNLDLKREAMETELGNQDILQQREFVTLWNILGEVMNTVAVNFGNAYFSYTEIYHIFLLLLQNSSFSVPPQTLDSIRIVEAQTARLNAPAIVFVPGVTDGEFPADVQESSIYSQQELEDLEQQYQIKIARLLPELYSDELLIVNKILAAPSKALYLTYPNINAAHTLAEPSPIIEEILSMFSEDAPILQTQDTLSISYYAWTMESAYFHFVRNLHQENPEHMKTLASLLEILKQDSVYAARIDKLTQEKQTLCTSPAIMQRLLTDKLVLSPTGIEQFYRCPFQYYCTHCLHLYIPEQVTLTKKYIGNFTHYCLEQMLRKYSVTEFSTLSPERLQYEINALSSQFSKENFPDAVRRDGRFQLNYQMNGRGLLLLLQNMQKELQQGQFQPVSYEVFLKEQHGALELSNFHHKIICEGKIDRIDICSQGNEQFFRVIDYKTGSKKFSPEKLAAGLDMQMLIYLFALQENHIYGETSHAVGALYMPSGQPKRKDYIAREETKQAQNLLANFYQMKGLLLDSAVVHMEQNVMQLQCPVMQKKERNQKEYNLYSVNEKQMQHLEQHVFQKINEMADRLYAGDIAPNPYLYLDAPPCSYCQCQELCGQEQQETNHMTAAEKMEALKTVFGDDED